MDNADANANRLKLANFFASCAIISSGALIIDSNDFGVFDAVELEASLAVAFGVLSLIVLAILQFVNLSVKFEKYTLYFHVTLWLSSVIVFTFHEPFQEAVGGLLNGFLGSWLGFVSAFFMLVRVIDVEGQVEKVKNVEAARKYLILLSIGGLVVTIAGGQAVDDDDTLEENGYALALGLTTILAAAALYLLQDEELSKYISMLLWLWLLIGALVTTTLGPFFNLGNGYVAVWVNVVVASYILAKYTSTYDSSSLKGPPRPVSSYRSENRGKENYDSRQYDSGKYDSGKYDSYDSNTY